MVTEPQALGLGLSEKSPILPFQCRAGPGGWGRAAGPSASLLGEESPVVHLQRALEIEGRLPWSKAFL